MGACAALVCSGSSRRVVGGDPSSATTGAGRSQTTRLRAPRSGACLLGRALGRRLRETPSLLPCLASANTNYCASIAPTAGRDPVRWPGVRPPSSPFARTYSPRASGACPVRALATRSALSSMSFVRAWTGHLATISTSAQSKIYAGRGGGVLAGDVQGCDRGDPRLSGATERSEGLRPSDRRRRRGHPRLDPNRDAKATHTIES